MSNKRLGPEAKIITLFTALPDDSKRIVLEIIRSQTQATRAPKSQSAPSAKSKSLLKRLEAQSAVITGTEKETATTAAVCAVPNCGQIELSRVHEPENPEYHVFHATIRKKPGKLTLPDNPEEFVHGATA